MTPNRWPTEQATRLLRASATAEQDDDRATLLQTIADYLDGTADYDRATYAEIAHAYLAGYEHATGETVRLDTALRTAGLGL